MAVISTQQQDALARAHRAQADRDQLIRALKACGVDEAEIVLDPPECLRNVFVFDFLRRVPLVGAATVRTLNAQAVRAGVNLAVSLGELSPTRRQWLADALRNRPLRPTAARRLSQRPQG